MVETNVSFPCFPLLFSMEDSQVSWEVWCDIGVLICSIKVLEQTPFSVWP